MDLKELNNLNMDDLKAKVLAFADKKTLIKGGIAFGAIVFFLIIFFNEFSYSEDNSAIRCACSLGTTNVWPGLWGLMSRNAYHDSP